MENLEDKKRFSLVRRAKSFVHAGRGVYIFLKTAHNSWIHIFIFAVAIFLGFYFKITNIEWMILILVGGVVFVSEAFNTAIEIDMNLTSPDYHPYAKDTKDVSAGAVLIASIFALIIGILIFIPHIF